MNTITKVAISNDKKNRTRSILIMAAIFLTTMLLTVISTFAYGILKMNKANAEVNYGSYYGVFQSLNAEQIVEMERRSEFTSIGLMESAGLIDGEDRISLVVADEMARKLTNLDTSLIQGSFPKAEEEIAAQASFFESMGYPDAAVGERVRLPYRADKEHMYEDQEFVISGLLKEQEEVAATPNYLVCCSQAFYEAKYPKESRRYQAYFRLDESVPITTDNIEKTLKELAAKCKIDGQQVKANGRYLMWELDPGAETITGCTVIGICVILFSIIVIYNIFQVGIAQKVQEYGKMKALGATNRQMKSLIFREGMLLTIFSIPAGLLAGYLIARKCFDWLNAKSNTIANGMEVVDISIFSIPVLLLSAVLALVTVMLALRRPMRIVAKISPVEAIRYQERSGKTGSGRRRGRREVTVFSMAMANISGSRKRTLMTVLTMGLSCVLFVVLANCVGNIDPDYDARKSVNHGQFQIELDYELNEKAYPENNLSSILKDNPLNQELMAEIRQIPGVTDVQSRQILYAEVNGKPTDIGILSREDFEKENGPTAVGEINYEKGSGLDSIYYGWSHFLKEGKIRLGDTMDVLLSNGTSQMEYQPRITGAFGSADSAWVIAEDAYQNMQLSGDSTGYVWVDCKEKDVARVEGALTELLEGKEHLAFTTYHDTIKVSEMATDTMKAFCYLFMLVLGMIGFMNLANTMIINITTKKQEYGILQAVGMTSRQLNKSLQLQGLIFTAGTVLVALGVGLPAGYGVFLYAQKKGLFGINVYHVPLVEIGCMIGIIAVLQLILSFILSRNLKKETLVERIRYQG